MSFCQYFFETEEDRKGNNDIDIILDVRYFNGYYLIERATMMNGKNDGFITLSNQQAECKISLWSGNLVSYCPKGEKEDVFWLGHLNKFDNVQAIRGGIPVCWPRFAEEKLNDHLPRHGFARLSDWCLKSVLVDETKIEAELSLVPDAKYNVDMTANLFIKITDKLEYCLETVNNGNAEFSFSEALHAYFNVGSVDDIEIRGLDKHKYRSSLDGNVYMQDGNLKIKGEFDAAFLEHRGKTEIVDPILKRVISVEKRGSNTTVVWNPDKDLAEMSEGQYKRFVCVEPANQGDAFVSLKPQEKHRIAMTVQVKNLIDS